MNKKTVIWIIIIVLLVIIAVAPMIYNRLVDTAETDNMLEQDTSVSDDNSEDAVEKEKMPDFTVYDVDGNAHNLSDYFGKPIIINFWASWCGPCRSEMPYFNTAYEEYGEDIHFLMVNVTDGSRETVERASSYIEKEGFSFPVYYDTDYSAYEAYELYTLPMSFFIDSEGYGVTYALGALTMEELQKGIDLIS